MPKKTTNTDHWRDLFIESYGRECDMAQDHRTAISLIEGDHSRKAKEILTALVSRYDEETARLVKIKRLPKSPARFLEASTSSESDDPR